MGAVIFLLVSAFGLAAGAIGAIFVAIGAAILAPFMAIAGLFA